VPRGHLESDARGGITFEDEMPVAQDAHPQVRGRRIQDHDVDRSADAALWQSASKHSCNVRTIADRVMTPV